ncbi:MAG: hypothetical protein IPL07_21270 [Acidimicrobiaceae bacterium]|nr:hypothetical protein [Acidimicrobiaceae bacterium]MBP7624337.1 hypothetical protein [Xanthomonadales bacterium]HRB05025.1 hypothetical protein [Ilumatobacteraceae bacterium]
MSAVGADVGAIRNFVLGLNQRSREITATTARLTALVETIAWVGPDRERFIADWHQTHQPGLLGLIGDLADAAREATRSADAQEAASAQQAGGS